MPISTKDKVQRLLVVDDESSISELISTSLRFVGFDVRTAANLAQQLTFLRGIKTMVFTSLLPIADQG